MNITIRHVVVCRSAQETAYTVPNHTLSFVFEGLEFSDSPGFHVGPDATGLNLYPQGLPIRFRYNARRVNYAILFDSDDVRLSSAPDRVDLHNAGDWFSIPLFIPVDTDRLEGWRLELEHIRSSFLMPTARNRLRAEMGVLNMLRHMMDGAVSSGGFSPAGRLKALIDADPAGTHTLEELCADCDYSADHLRILFMKEFGATPKQYRIRRRMAEAMEYIAGSRLSIKEISGRLGFEQLSHFSAAFKAVHNLQPREALRRFRGTGQPPSLRLESQPYPPPESINLTTICPSS